LGFSQGSLISPWLLKLWGIFGLFPWLVEREAREAVDRSGGGGGAMVLLASYWLRGVFKF